MNLEPFLNEFFKTPEAKETCRILRLYGSKCNSIIEFGSRGGITAIALLQALIDRKCDFKPRYIGIDLIQDDSIVKIAEIANSINVSFQFWKGHSSDFPLTESDGFLWDTFHCAGNLINDLKRVSPFIHKYIIIIGTKVDGEASEASRRELDFEIVAKEMRIEKTEVGKGLNSAINLFLDTDNSWRKAHEQGDITILERSIPSNRWLFKGPSF